MSGRWCSPRSSPPGRESTTSSSPPRRCVLDHRVSRVFVTGGTGVIGTALVARLLARGDGVVALARSEPAGPALRSRGASSGVFGDALDEDGLVSGMDGFQLAFKPAGLTLLCVRDP